MIRTFGRVEVTSEAHGPFVRHAFTPLDPPLGAQVSIARVGDVLVDTGSRRITDAVLAVLGEDPPKRILLTHQHEDHIGNVRPILEAFGALPVFAPRALVDRIVALREVPRYRAAYWGHPHPVYRDDLSPYDPGEVFAAGGVSLEAIATPGHTPPHVAFAARLGNVAYVLTGDLYASRPLEGFYEAAMDDTVRSYRAIAALAEQVVMVPTHGRVRTDARKVLCDAAQWIEVEAEAIEALTYTLDTRDPIALAASRYGDDPILTVSEGEMGKAIFVRAIVTPARALPVAPLAVPRA